VNELNWSYPEPDQFEFTAENARGAHVPPGGRALLRTLLAGRSRFPIFSQLSLAKEGMPQALEVVLADSSTKVRQPPRTAAPLLVEKSSQASSRPFGKGELSPTVIGFPASTGSGSAANPVDIAKHVT
jgi:hypothetical protein